MALLDDGIATLVSVAVAKPPKHRTVHA